MRDPDDPLAPHAAAILEHMNADHADAVRLYVLAFRGVAADDARMVAVDARGFDVASAAGRFRIEFPEPVATPEDARRALVAMVREARARVASRTS